MSAVLAQFVPSELDLQHLATWVGTVLVVALVLWAIYLLVDYSAICASSRLVQTDDRRRLDAAANVVEFARRRS